MQLIHKPLPKRFTPYNERMAMEKCEVNINTIKSRILKIPFNKT